MNSIVGTLFLLTTGTVVGTFYPYPGYFLLKKSRRTILFYHVKLKHAMNTCTKCNYSATIGTQADANSFVGPCKDGHHFPPAQPGNYLIL